MNKTLAQQRAADALQKVMGLTEKANSDARKWKPITQSYVAYVESLPVTIMTCGLGQAAASLLASAKNNSNDAHYILYQHLASWLCRNDDLAPYRDQQDSNLLAAITSGDQETYLRAQVEALAWLEWLKKLAVAYLKPKKSGKGESDGNGNT